MKFVIIAEHKRPADWWYPDRCRHRRVQPCNDGDGGVSNKEGGGIRVAVPMPPDDVASE